jgi:hypothetical protein
LNCIAVGFCKCSYLKIYFSLKKLSSIVKYSRQLCEGNHYSFSKLTFNSLLSEDFFPGQ